MTTFSCVIASCGDPDWGELAQRWALPSVEGQRFDEVLIEHIGEADVAGARNELIGRATSDFVVLLDADDQLCDGYLDAMKATARYWNLSRPRDLRDNPLLLVPAMGLVDNDGVCLTVPSIPDWDRWPDVNCVCIGAAWPRRLLIDVGGFSPRWDMFEDYSAAIACVQAGARLVPVSDAVYCATLHPGSRNRGNPAAQKATYDAIRAQYDMAAIPRNPPLTLA